MQNELDTPQIDEAKTDTVVESDASIEIKDDKKVSDTLDNSEYIEGTSPEIDAQILEESDREWFSGSRAIVKVLAGIYLIYLGGSTIRGYFIGATDVNIYIVFLIGGFFILFGLFLFISYLWGYIKSKRN